MKKDKISSYEESRENKKQILAVLDDQQLIFALEKMAAEEQAQLRLGRPETPDIFVFSAHVKIVDREYLGAENWNLFCTQWLKEAEEKRAPVIIVDNSLTNTEKQYKELIAVEEKVKHIQQSAVDLIVKTARRMMKNNEAEITAVRAVTPGRVPPESERIELE